MTKTIKIITLSFLIYFILLAIYGIACFIKYYNDVNEYGGEMGDVFFMSFLFFASGYYGLFLLWTLRVYKRSEVSKSTSFQLSLIFLFGICTSLFILGKIYFNW